ncbi:thiamine pyrophosphate-binding protein [Streptomyces sp. NPDC052109]|uniref:thiamine pyrophosphate-binding protein n=1 Tax=Streptomyces sp. NPDC052109 TaxID=3155527 RepID=UPI003439B014
MPGLEVDPLAGVLGGGPGVPWFVQARGAESAALMACADAKLTGRLGCCLAPPGAGALRLLGGLYDAAADRAPVLAVVGEETTVRPDGGRVVRHLAEVSVFREQVSGPELMGDALNRATRAALTDRGVASLVVPRHVLAATAPPGLGDSVQVGLWPPVRPPDERDVRRAAEVLDGAGRPAVVVGNAGRAACGQAVGVASLLGVATTALARDALPDDLSCVTGVVGPFGSEAEGGAPAGVRHAAPRGCGGPRSGPAAGSRLHGDATAALETLIPLLRRATDRPWRARGESTVRSWRAEGQTRASRYFGTSVNPRSVVAELSERLPDRSAVVTDAGTSLDWWIRHLRLRNGMRSLLSGHLGLPGAAVPYAVAARFAPPTGRSSPSSVTAPSSPVA